METRSEEHEKARAKRITGSRIKTVMRGGYKAKNTLSKMLHSDEPERFFSVENTPNMPERLKQGHIRERQVRGDFFFDHPEYEVVEAVFLTPESCFNDCGRLVPWIGVSPDLVLEYNDGPDVLRAGGEVKSPEKLAKFEAWERAGCVPVEHIDQVTLSLLVTGWDYWWFIAYHPDAPQRFEYKLTRDQAPLEQMYNKITQFLDVHEKQGTFEPASGDMDDLIGLF